MKGKFTVIQDTREQLPWTFPVSDKCNGVIVDTLSTGDYTLLENRTVCIERKGKLSEFATNINEDRFWRELERMEKFRHPFLVLEFSDVDIYRWPNGSGIPLNKLKYIKVTPNYIIRKISEIEINYKTKVILAGKHGQDIVMSLFKRIAELG